MTSIRDMNCGNDVAMMDKLGRFEREFVVYGVGFVQEGQVRYLISGRQDKLQQFNELALEREIYPTPIVQSLISTTVPSGTQSDIAWKAKVLLASKLQATYRRPFFQTLQRLGEQRANDAAQPLLLAEQKRLCGVFDQEALALFEGLVRQALAQKVLTLASFEQFQKFLEKMRRQMEDDPLIKKTFQRTFSGFMYETPAQERAYFTDAQPETVWEKRSALLREGYLATPILSKTYWFDYNTPLKSIRRQFADELRARLDEAFWQRVKSVSQLPGAIGTELFAQLTEPVQGQLNASERAALNGYGYRFRALAAHHTSCE